ncbi:hypothetical protein GW17_00036150 [Ensete ventricosum]|nr:hypothetical protein GW17_00036150 [Ensete ventricosum]
MRGEKITHRRRNRPWATDSAGEEQHDTKFFLSLFFFSHFFFLPPTAVTARNLTDRFRVVMGQKQPQSMVLLGSGQSAYRSAGGPVHVETTILGPSSPAGRPRAVAALTRFFPRAGRHSLCRFFSHARRWNISPRGEKDRGDSNN